MNTTSRTPGQIRRQLGKSFRTIPTYCAEIPVAEIGKICAAAQLELVNEDGTPFDAIFCGETGTCSIKLADLTSDKWQMNYSYAVRTPIKVQIHLMWHLMPSGRYEITVWAS